MVNGVAHVRKSDGIEQSIAEHLVGVQKLAEDYGEKIDMKHVAGLSGLLHDLGKYSNEFQEYIWKAVNYPDSPPKKGSVDHSTAGGKLLYELFHNEDNTVFEKLLAEIVGNVIISHHAYLQDYLNVNLESKYIERVRDKEIPQYNKVKSALFENVISEENFTKYITLATQEIERFLKSNSPEKVAENLMFLTKYIFSTLIDADRTDSMMFEENLLDVNSENRSKLFEDYYEKLKNKLALFEKELTEENEIGALRKQMSQQCEDFSEKDPGVYTLSIPTGGGKTLASLRYALKHALKYGKERILYIVPYTTIIEQNAADIRNILQDKENILEFHSNVIEEGEEAFEDSDDDFFEDTQKLKLSKESWESPIVFTTMVQFLNVFYDNGTRSIRRLHNLSNSVIIFDEVQKVPTECVSLFNKSVNFLKEYCSSTVLLCTATQPSLDYVENKLEINSDGEIISNLPAVVEAFKRVELFDYATDQLFNTEKLSLFVERKVEEDGSVLVVMNTRKVVKELFISLKETMEKVYIYHLSTSMCAANRKNILKDIREKLNNNEKVICVSTQLIEAGVDISFKSVIRSLAGLDSIAQAAGRCNRHGESGRLGKVYIIDHQDEKLDKLKAISAGKNIAKKLLIDLKRESNRSINDIFSQEVMSRYFQEFYNEFRHDLDYPVRGYRESMVKMLTDNKRDSERHDAYLEENGKTIELFNISSMNTAAKHFQVIENNTTSVIVPYGEGTEIISQLISAETITDLNRLLKEAQQYIVNIYDNEKRIISENDGLYGVFDNMLYILSEGMYDNEFGISYEGEAEMDNLMF